VTIYAAATQKSRAYGYLFIHCNNCPVNMQYILGEKQTSICQQGRGSPLVCPTQRTRPAIVRGCALCYHTAISASAKHSPESHIPVSNVTVLRVQMGNLNWSRWSRQHRSVPFSYLCP